MTGKWILSWRHSGFSVHSRGWAEMIRKVYEVDPLVCPKCRGEMKVISFLTDSSVVDRIINHLELTSVADRPPPPQVGNSGYSTHPHLHMHVQNLPTSAPGGRKTYPFRYS